ncbi:hypothetical protein ABE424_13170 [Stenotrophomonas sp. TWI1149]|uniref:hypothetical protein n=1 Tax=unclassified Stenotrophomonas TaxID=196198 RepID=UPI0032098222
MGDPTVSQLRQRAAATPASALSFQILMWDFDVPQYAAWVDLVEGAMIYQINKVAEKRHYLKDLGEDAITTVVELALDNLGLNCSAKVVNGNVDMVIEWRGFKWLGEAKIAGDLQKIFHGYQQLTSRYATGQPGQTAGGLLLYCMHDRASVIMESWKAALGHEIPGANIQDGPVPLSFRSDDDRNGSGQLIGVVHLAFPLYHVPEEGTWTLSKEAISVGRTARKAARKSIAKSSLAANDEGKVVE